jgi:hypothetical protein
MTINHVFMKKLFILILLSSVSYLTLAQETKPGCDKTSCGPEGTKKGEAVVITTLRNDLQTVITKMSKSTVSFDKEIADMEIAKGATDDECLLYISQAASAVRYELVNKVDPSKLNASLKNYKPANFSTKQKMVSGLKKEIELLVAQAEKL